MQPTRATRAAFASVPSFRSICGRAADIAARIRGAALLALLAVGGGCAGTTPVPPGEPTPPVTQLRVAPDAARDLVSYRELGREDFLASQPPAGADRARGHVAAATCAYLIPSPEMRFRAVRKPRETLFTAEVVGLSFSARMDRQCSWWDTQNRFRPDDYVLEHEQIHFALIELEARALNQQRDAIAARVRSTGETGEAALAEIQRKFKLELEAGAKRAAERTRQLDAETSLGFEPEAQAAWAERIRQELDESQPAASQ